uniref:ATPase n=1 Tax=Rhabditophanes sp. KR3021 TaxID=114890 RepID=A0AC35UDW8_9BILA
LYLQMFFTFKFPYLTPTYRVVLIGVLLGHFCIESVRLYMGYTGNLEENVPYLSGQFITALILQLPTSAFLLFNFDIIQLPLEIPTLTIHLILIILELILSLFTIKKIGDYQVKKFMAKILAEDVKKNE